MNKTVNINLGGLFFHIDEDAYQKLTRYFDAIKRSLSPDGKDEIMNDIEGRIAELLAEKLKSDKQVVSIREVDEVITIMGQPEDYRLDEENAQANTKSTYFAPGYTATSRKFYRDGDRGMIGGVSAGIAHYFRIDPLWIRILFIISPFISFGSSILVYILLWILIPKAITTTEKLEMTGEAINISNIEKKVREEFQGISDRIQSVDYDKLGNNAKTAAERVGGTIGDVFSTIFKAIAKVVGAFIVIITAVSLGSMLAGFIFLCFSSTMPNAAWYPYMNIVNYTDMPLWLLGMLGFLAIGIPVFFLFLLGLKILVNNLKPVGSITGYTFLALWIISVALIIYFGLRQATQISSESKTTTKEYLHLPAGEILNVKFKNNDYYSKEIEHFRDYRFTQDADGKDVIYSNNIAFYVMKTDDITPYVQIEKIAMGESLSDARKRAEKINYNFKFEGNTLILDNYLLTDVAGKFRNQKVEIYLYLPENTLFEPDTTVDGFNRTDNVFFDMRTGTDSYMYIMERNELKCLNCPERDEDGNEIIEAHAYADEVTEHGTIKIKDKNMDIEVTINEDSIEAKQTVKPTKHK